MKADHPDLPLEQARNAEYLVNLKLWLETPVQFGLSRNEVWVRPTTTLHGKSYGTLHPLIGRVGLREPFPYVGRDFYIGARRLDGDMQIISWLAPMARAFFQPYSPPDELRGRIVGIRTFTHRLDELTAIDEEWFDEVSDSPFLQAELKVEAPRSRRTRRPMVKSAETKEPEPLTPMPRTADVGSPKAGKLAGMRAAAAVIDRLSAPRTSEMASVMATLQPDQHDLATRSPKRDLIIQGHPGTGKTVVAAYRAGFLATPDAPDRGEFGGGQGRVLLIGPTAGYSKHVAGLMRPFRQEGFGKIVVKDLGTFMAEIVGIRTKWTGSLFGEPNDVDARAFDLVQRAAQIVHSTSPRSTSKRNSPNDQGRDDLRLTYTTLRANGLGDQVVTEDRDAIRWVTRLPDFEEALCLRRYLPLLAQCRLAQRSNASPVRFNHIIVDEAQDVSPMEWSILQHFLHPLWSHWTLVGDQNQRRSNISYTSWQLVSDHLRLNDGEGAEPQIMQRGYRSTNAILLFADRLLIPALRQAGSIQEDGAPVQCVRETKSRRLNSCALDVAQELARKHEHGTVALITVYPENLVERMIDDGWRRPSTNDFRQWSREGTTLQVYSPERARGLEFDAVVVIEPRHFDNDNGRHGLLYTSLTRANRELAIVHHQALPAALRAEARP